VGSECASLQGAKNELDTDWSTHCSFEASWEGKGSSWWEGRPWQGAGPLPDHVRHGVCCAEVTEQQEWPLQRPQISKLAWLPIETRESSRPAAASAACALGGMNRGPTGRDPLPPVARFSANRPRPAGRLTSCRAARRKIDKL
jgi:hypothetical protein